MSLATLGVTTSEILLNVRLTKECRALTTNYVIFFWKKYSCLLQKLFRNWFKQNDATVLNVYWTILNHTVYTGPDVKKFGRN